MGKYKINNQVFSSKEKITEKIRSLERKYDDYEKIGDADRKFLIEIFRYHPNFEDKMDGMTDLVFAESVHYNGRTRCIFVAYGDINEDIRDRPMDDISWVECIKNIPVPTKHRIHFKFTFGKYKGKTIEAVNEIDRAYLHWVTNSEFKNRSVKVKVGQFLKYNYIPYNPIAHKKEKEKMKPMEEEIWKPIVIENLPEGYQVSNKGNVKNKRGKLVGYMHNGTGYMRVDLITPRRIHRLVLMTFDPIENMEEMDVHHKDGIKTNNRLENLKWMSKGDHYLIERELGNNKIGEKGKDHIAYRGLIGKFNGNDVLEDVFCGRASIVKAGLTDSAVYMTVTNTRKEYKGYVFRRFPIGTKPEIGKKYDIFDPMFTQFFKYNLDDIPNKKYKQLELTL